MELGELKKTPPDEVSYLFNEITRASWHCWHRIVMDPDLSIWVANHVNLVDDFIPRIKWIGNNYPFVGEQIKESKASLTIKLDAVTKITRVKDQFHWVVGHKFFTTSKMKLDRINLLVENEINDGGMLDLVLREEAKRVGVGVLDINPYNGGGSAMLKIFKKKIIDEKEEITVCIVDRDYLVFNKNMSKGLNEIYIESGKDDFIGGLLILPCNTIENFLPLSILESLISKGQLHVIKKLESLLDKSGKSIVGEKFILCHNIRDGLKIKNVIEHLNSSNLTTSTIDRIKKLLTSVYSMKATGFENFEFEGCGKIINTIMKKNSEKAEIVKKKLRNIIKNDSEWERIFGKFLNPILWFLCCDQEYNYEASNQVSNVSTNTQDE